MRYQSLYASLMHLNIKHMVLYFVLSVDYRLTLLSLGINTEYLYVLNTLKRKIVNCKILGIISPLFMTNTTFETTFPNLACA